MVVLIARRELPRRPDKSLPTEEPSIDFHSLRTNEKYLLIVSMHRLVTPFQEPPETDLQEGLYLSLAFFSLGKGPSSPTASFHDFQTNATLAPPHPPYWTFTFKLASIH